MIEFKDVELTDKTWAKKLLTYSDYRGCEYSFGNNFIWKKIFQTKISRYKDFYLIKCDSGFFFPAGKGDLRDAVEALKTNAAADGKPLNFITMNKASMEWLKENYPSSEIETDRSSYDYIYGFEDLAELKGKKYHSKRNHLNRFRENNWSFEPITEKNISECEKMNELWCIENNCEGESDMEKENCAVRCGLKNFFELDFIGGLLRVDGEVVAFTFGEPQNRDTFVVHAEKAFSRIQGAYPAINNEFVNFACASYDYINREEDMGLENLRKAKMSYRPVFMEEKFKAVIM